MYHTSTLTYQKNIPIAAEFDVPVIGGGHTFPLHYAPPQGDATPGYSDLCVLDSGKAVGLLHCHERHALFTRIPAPKIQQKHKESGL